MDFRLYSTEGQNELAIGKLLRVLEMHVALNRAETAGSGLEGRLEGCLRAFRRVPSVLPFLSGGPRF